jgi:uncharacterized protein YhjY with autotransporter beta-barrel domain
MKRAGILFCVCTSALTSGSTHAANPVFQDFFFDVCVNPAGALAERCRETPGGAGDLSGDAESSLNPSQTLGSTDGALAEVRARSKEARERADRYRPGSGTDAEADAALIDLGPFSLLLNGRREWEERERETDVDPERGYEADRRAIEVGLDRRFSDRFVAGLLYAYADGALKFDPDRAGVDFNPAGDAGSIDRETHSVTLFGVARLTERAYLEVNAGYASSDYSLTRNAAFQESTRTVPQTNLRSRAGTDGDQTWFGVTSGYDWSAGAASYGIYAGAVYAQSSIDGYQERDTGNSGLTLVVDDVERDAVTAHLGFRAQRAIGTSFAVWVPQLRIEYELTGGVEDREATVRFADDASGNRFDLAGSGSDDYFNVAIGMVAIFPNGWIPFADLEGLVGARDRQQYRFTLGIRKEL